MGTENGDFIWGVFQNATWDLVKWGIQCVLGAGLMATLIGALQKLRSGALDWLILGIAFVVSAGGLYLFSGVPRPTVTVPTAPTGLEVEIERPTATTSTSSSDFVGWVLFGVTLISFAIYVYRDTSLSRHGVTSGPSSLLPPLSSLDEHRKSRDQFVNFVTAHEAFKQLVSVGRSMVSVNAVPRCLVLIVYADELDQEFARALSRFFEFWECQVNIHPMQKDVKISGIRIDGVNLTLVNTVRDFLRSVGLVGVESEIEFPVAGMDQAIARRSIKVIVGPGRLKNVTESDNRLDE